MSKVTLTMRRDPEVIRQLIAQTKGYGAVSFIKKDGELRKLCYQHGRIGNYVVGSELGQRMAATFAKNNPDMVRLVDVHQARKGKPPIRTVDFSRVLSIRANGVVVRFF